MKTAFRHLAPSLLAPAFAFGCAGNTTGDESGSTNRDAAAFYDAAVPNVVEAASSEAEQEAPPGDATFDASVGAEPDAVAEPESMARADTRRGADAVQVE